MKLKDLPIKYDFKMVEEGKYQKWVEKGYFTAGDKSKIPYTVVIPPPNITGKLHLGHVLDTTMQDIIVRRKRMQGFDVLYLPGMDHASIATQAKIEAKLRTQKISRYDLGREKFMKVAWEWKEEYAKLIRDQWEVLGLSLDYSRERFTLDEGLNQAVNYVFVKMYNEGLIYRGEKIINWDVQSKTALSNIEVEYQDVEGALYYFLYPFVNTEGGITIATTRPETMFGDTAIMVHPKDERYQAFIGKLVYIPGTNRQIPIIADEYVDRGFGTGAVKVTPAHDPNDYEIGLTHHLERPLCMNEDGTMNELAGKYQGMDRFTCRDAVVNDLTKIKLCLKIEKMVHSVGHSERTGVIVEPRLSKQWFVAMDKLAKVTLSKQDSSEKVSFFPNRFEKIFANWLVNIQDWCISRQLWWGHRIPAWYKEDQIYVGMQGPKEPGWVQDEDALDTWFSSALWPFSTLGWPKETEDFKRYFPTNVLVTGYDIIFFWVARMVFQSHYLTNQKPFKDVLIHGIIRDELGRKVSKSLGNGVDMLEVRDQYGMDSLRYFLTTASAPGQDIRYTEEKMEASWNFINKLWNISRFVGINFDNNQYQNEKINDTLLNELDKWILSKLNEVIFVADENFEKYEFGEAAKAIYKFAWNDFASWYLEMTKVIFQEGNHLQKINTCAVLNHVLVAILKLLHPFMPFVTEEIYQSFNEGSIVISTWPKELAGFTSNNAQYVDLLFEVISRVRLVRAEKNVPNSKPLKIEMQIKEDDIINFFKQNAHYLKKFVNFSELIISSNELDTAKKVVNVLNNVILAIPLAQLVDTDQEKQKLLLNKERLEIEIRRGEGMLNNPNFINKAPFDKINIEKIKLNDYKKQLEETERLLQEIDG
ncbi:MAG: valine--tRNA ligase [Bacilli bacterium]